MRRRLWKFLPIVLMALTVQIFAPIAACWAAGIVASDPLQAAFICHEDASSPGQTDPGGHSGAHSGCCSVCSLAHAGAPVDAPQAVVTTPHRASHRVVWRDTAADLIGSRTGSHAQARAPPVFFLT